MHFSCMKNSLGTFQKQNADLVSKQYNFIINYQIMTIIKPLLYAAFLELMVNIAMFDNFEVNLDWCVQSGEQTQQKVTSYQVCYLP